MWLPHSIKHCVSVCSVHRKSFDFKLTLLSAYAARYFWVSFTRQKILILGQLLHALSGLSRNAARDVTFFWPVDCSGHGHERGVVCEEYAMVLFACKIVL